MNTTTIVINSTKLALEPSIIQMIPLLSAHNGGDIQIPAEVSAKYMEIIAKILKRAPIIPMVDISSHKVVYAVIKLAKCLGISNDVVSTGFIGWTSHFQWIDLWQREYLYLIHLENENLVDFDKYFRFRKGVFEDVSLAMTLPELRSSAENYINMMIFFKTYNFSQCFGENNPKVQQRIDELNKERTQAWRLFLINPHEDFLKDYFAYTYTNYKVWDSATVSVDKPPIIGRTTIVGIETALARLRKFSYGLFDKSLNPAITTPFPFENAIVAGGSMTKILDAYYDEKHARQSDVDIFIFASTFDERVRSLERILEWFKSTGEAIDRPITYYAVSGSVVTIYVKDVSRKFQVISIDNPNPFNILDRFDMTHIQWCLLDGHTFLGTPEACRSMRERVTHMSNLHRLQTTRLIKALYCGYSVKISQAALDEGIDITPILDDPNSMLQQYIRQLHIWYYPRSDPEMEPHEERLHILSMIERESKATFITDDPDQVMGKVVIGGNFEHGYESMLFNTFDITKIKRITYNRRNMNNVPVIDTRNSQLRFTTPILTVSKVRKPDGEGLEITLIVDDIAFRDFCAMLENKIFKMYRNTEVTRHILNDKNELVFIIPKHRLDYQLAHGISCLRSQIGEALNIEEDVNAGDSLQILFSIRILVLPNERAVNLKPEKFVKYQKTQPAPSAPDLKFIERELPVDTALIYEEPKVDLPDQPNQPEQ
jgi:hypothetical protein